MRWVVIGCALVCALGVTSCGGSGAGTTCDTPVSTDSVTIVDFAFDPACAAVASGATITLTNGGAVPHTFTVKDTAVNVVLQPGDTQPADLSGIAAGTYAVVCTYHPQMSGALKVG